MDYQEHTFDYIIEAHIERLLEEGIIKKRSHASSYVKKSFLQFYEQDGWFDFNPFFKPNEPLSTDHKPKWGYNYSSNKTTLWGEYTLPALSLDTVDYETLFCFPPFWNDLLNASWGDEQKAKFSETYQKSLQARLEKEDKFFSYTNLEDYSIILNAFGYHNKTAAALSSKFLALERAVKSLASELKDVQSERLTELAVKFIEAGRELERYDLSNKGVYDRLHKQAISGGKSIRPFSSLTDYERFMLRLYSEDKSRTPEILVNLAIDRGLLSSPEGFPVPSNKSIIRDLKMDRDIKSFGNMKRSVRDTLIKNYNEGFYPEANSKGSF